MPFPAMRAFERFNTTPIAFLTADPAANVEISATVPAGVYWDLVAANVTLVTDATVANRQVTLVIDDGVNVIAKIAAQPVQAASLTWNYTWATSGPDRAAATGVTVNSFLPTILMLPGYRVTTSTLNRAATDNFGAMTLYVVKYTA